MGPTDHGLDGANQTQSQGSTTTCPREEASGLALAFGGRSTESAEACIAPSIGSTERAALSTEVAPNRGGGRAEAKTVIALTLGGTAGGRTATEAQ